MTHSLSCFLAWGLPGPGLSPCLLHWQLDSLPLSHQEAPFSFLNLTYLIFKIGIMTPPSRTTVRIKGKNILKIFYVYVKFSGCTWSFKIRSFHSELGYQFKLCRALFLNISTLRFKNAFHLQPTHLCRFSISLFQDIFYDHLPLQLTKLNGLLRSPPLVLLPNDRPWVIASPA